MVAMSSAIRALVVVAMAICSTTTVAIFVSTSAGVASTTLHSSHGPATIKRRLKRTTAMEATETSEERGISFSIPIMDSISSSLESIPTAIYEQSQRWMSWLMLSSSDREFQRLQLDKLDSEKQNKLFEDPQFLQWVTFVEEKYSNPEAAAEKMLKTLANHYREDAALADVLVAGTEIANTKELAFNLLVIQVDKWKESGKSVEQVFTYLKLEELGDGLFESPRFDLWLQFFGARSLPKEYEVFVSATKAATKLFDEANKAAMATQTANEADKPALQKAEELAVKKADKANEAMDEANSAFYKAYQPYMKPLLSILQEQYKNKDNVLKNALTKGFRVENKNLRDIARKLLTHLQLSRWKESGETADKLFTSLELEKMGNKLFETPLFLQWVIFVELEHSNDYIAAYKDVLSTLAKHYREDAALADVLVAGTEIFYAQQLAINLLVIHSLKWLESGKSVEQVFTYLKLEELGDGLFESPRFELWLRNFGSHSLPKEYKAFRLAWDSAREAANKVAMATETADEAEARVLKVVKELADMKLQEVSDAYDEAYGLLFPKILSFLRDHYDDTVLKDALKKGLSVNNENIREHAKKLLQILDDPTHGRS